MSTKDETGDLRRQVAAQSSEIAAVRLEAYALRNGLSRVKSKVKVGESAKAEKTIDRAIKTADRHRTEADKARKSLK